MIRAMALVLTAASVLGVSAVAGPPAVAQAIQVGPGGVGVDLRSRGERDRDELRAARREREMRRDMREREMDRRDRRMERRMEGRRGCRTVTVRERDDFGRMVTRRTEECR